MSEDHTPADFEADGDEGNANIDRLLAEIQSLKEQVLRYAADAENTKRRAEREMNDARAYAITKFARDLLGAADIFDRALAAAPTEVDGPMKNFIVGVEMTAKELQGAFDRNGLKRIEPAKGEKFDPHKHQAMMEQPGEDVPPGGVIQVMQPGYELLGRLVRPAMVVVAAKGASAAPAANPYADADADGEGGGDAGGGSVDTRA
ncbi:MAG: nucleotide exchange factor GrpE [Alphaproteobacteria bacterium]|nr:nucleotide exchange factor GrpE [Alphaproteobacteria bacterium]MBU1516297.1 nucleotide exchange factor GrpE [Alphaproteobacteria bacterium]MBU2093137.1 nucleotide exchange factor GrpE [Alphaproteobacteria bacterium]MBU2151521.1 nucleotide exchange factor GrpE [Alphaproteobacteria bacterium]MBU2306491.1 nucleotide exchange factor GrpE [Alphaproteobacteria bacterium]